VDEKVRGTLRLCADVLSLSWSKSAQVAYAELRIHPTAPSGVGVHVVFEDGTAMWLVAEE
jgi:hypothetical protein